MTAVETRGLGECRGGWLRRASLAALALYLAPAVLVVLLIGVLGVACCAALRLLAGAPGRLADARTRRHAASQAVGMPHVRAASRSRLPSR